MASRAALRAAPKLPCGIAVPHALSTAVKSSSSASSSSGAAAIRRALAADSGSPPHTTAIYSDSPVSLLWRGPTISYSPISSLRGRSVHGPSVCFNSLIYHRPFAVGHTARCTSAPPASGSAGSRRPGSAWGSSGPPGAGRPFCFSERKRETAEDTPDARLRGADVHSGPEVEGRFDRPFDLFE